MTQLEVFRDFNLGGNLAVRVLVVEQDPDYADIIATLLKSTIQSVDYVKNAGDALNKISSGAYDLVFLDTRLNSIEKKNTLLNQIRQQTMVPVIALNEQVDEENGLNLLINGADYELQKPFTPHRLRAAVTAVLRRSELGGVENTDPILSDTIETKGLSLSLGRLEVTVNNKKINLSAREFALLQFMMSNPNRIFTREELAARSWGWAKGGEMRAVDSTIKRLRRKVEEDARHPRFILTERNEGYQFFSR